MTPLQRLEISAEHWRDHPPSEQEIDDQDIIGWVFRGRFYPDERFPPKCETGEDRPLRTVDRGVVLRVMLTWAVYGKHMWSLDDLRGQWCPIYSPSLVRRGLLKGSARPTLADRGDFELPAEGTK